ncbi:RNA polymerase sigma factor [Pseudomonas sp. ABC1]|nr:RNA polymerase sigma factor [Pseudomonas sp. ABC1]
MVALAQHYDELVDYIRLRFRSSQFASDVVHDVCLQLLENPPVERVKTPFAFLRRVSVNRAIDRHRSDRTRNRYFEPLDERADLRHHEHDGAAELVFMQQLEALVAIVEALPARQRQIFLLHRIHGMSQRELAEELGISANMVTQHFNRAMRTIASQWQPAQDALHGRQH